MEVKGQEVSRVSSADPDITLVNEVSFSKQPALDFDQQSEMTEDTTSSSEPDSEGTPAPQDSRQQVDLRESSRKDDGIRNAIIGIADVSLPLIFVNETLTDLSKFFHALVSKKRLSTRNLLSINRAGDLHSQSSQNSLMTN